MGRPKGPEKVAVKVMFTTATFAWLTAKGTPPKSAFAPPSSNWSTVCFGRCAARVVASSVMSGGTKPAVARRTGDTRARPIGRVTPLDQIADIHLSRCAKQGEREHDIPHPSWPRTPRQPGATQGSTLRRPPDSRSACDPRCPRASPPQRKCGTSPNVS
jgi:hypothetical protein